MIRASETVENVVLLRAMIIPKQLYTMSMDVRARFHTESNHIKRSSFQVRFILSLISCKRCVVLNDGLNILSIF